MSNTEEVLIRLKTSDHAHSNQYDGKERNAVCNDRVYHCIHASSAVPQSTNMRYLDFFRNEVISSRIGFHCQTPVFIGNTHINAGLPNEELLVLTIAPVVVIICAGILRSSHFMVTSPFNIKH